MDNLDFAKNLIGSHDYVWVPIVALAAITIIAGLIGFWNGWKTSLYFFGWNLVGVISGVFATGAIMNALDSVSILKVVSASAESLWGLLILFVYMLAVNFIAFLSYWVFRSKLKKSMKLNKKAGKSNLSSRFIGMGIAITSAAPTMFFLSNATAIMSEENGFTKFTDTMARAFTGGKYNGTAEDRVLAKNIDVIQDLASVFGGSDDDAKANLAKQETRDKVQKILNTDFAKNVDSIYDSIKNSPMGSNLPKEGLNSVSSDQIKDNVPAMGIKFEPGKKRQFHDAALKMFGDDEGKVQALIAQLEADPAATPTH